MRPAGSAEALERRRERAVSLLREGWPPVDVARKVGVDRRSVRRWRAAFEREGRRGLEARFIPGRPLKLREHERARLVALLVRGALRAGYTTDLWTCPRVRDLIAREFGVEYHVDHIGRVLRSLGWTPQKPKRRARERDEERIQGWIRETWPRVRKTRRG